MSKKFKIIAFFITIGIMISVAVNLNIGFMKLNFADFFVSDTDNSQIAQLRINRVLAMALAGISIPTSGFLLQEYFQNPLAGPSVLGITSVASLSVAFYIFFCTESRTSRSFTEQLPEHFGNWRKLDPDAYFTGIFKQISG